MSSGRIQDSEEHFQVDQTFPQMRTPKRTHLQPSLSSHCSKELELFESVLSNSRSTFLGLNKRGVSSFVCSSNFLSIIPVFQMLVLRSLRISSSRFFASPAFVPKQITRQDVDFVVNPNEEYFKGFMKHVSSQSFTYPDFNRFDLERQHADGIQRVGHCHVEGQLR